MTDETQKNESDAAVKGSPGATSDGRDGPRMGPPVIFALVQLGAIAFALQASTLMEIAAGMLLGPGVSTLLLAIWWMRTRVVSFRTRLTGIGLFAGALAWVALTQESDGARLLMFALPALSIGVVAVLFATTPLPWTSRRWCVVAYMIGCAALFTATRVDDIGGDIMPILAWRWSPTSEELFLASIDEKARTNRIATVPAAANEEDWPEFRGTGRDSTAPRTSFATNWDDAPPREIWRKRVGLGWSSFAAVGDYIFTQEQRGPDEVIVCYEAQTGEEVWVNRIAERFDEAMGSGPRATPTFHKGNLYTMGATGILQRIDAATGVTAWTRDLKEDTGAALPVWGFSSSPLVVAQLVVVFAGGTGDKGVVAYNIETGAMAWSAGDGTHTYSSVQLARIDDVPQLLMTCDVGLQSFAPETGDLLWEHRWEALINPRCVQPLVVDSNSVMIGTAGGQGTRRILVEKNGDSWEVEEQWTTRRFRPYFNDFVIHEGYCYGFDGKRFMCIDAETGERMWKGGAYGGQALLIPDMDTLLVLSERGDVILVRATPEKHEEIAKFKAISGKTWNHPVISRGKLYVRNSNEAACFELPMIGAAQSD